MLSRLPKIFIVAVVLLLPEVAYAQVVLPNPLGACGVSFTALLMCVWGWVFTIAAPLAVLMFIVAAFLFLTSAGDPGRLSTAKSALLWAFIGLAVVLLSQGFIFVLCDVLSASCPPLSGPVMSAADIVNLICRIAGFLFTFAFVFSLLMLLFSAFTFMTAGGDAEKVTQARKTFLYAVVGLVVALSAKGLVLVIGALAGIAVNAC